jgi:hypothetical protein
MTKKLLFAAMALMFAGLFTASSSAQSCASFSGVNVQYMGVGSSAQFNSFAYAAENLILAETGSNNVVNFWATSSAPIEDHRSGNSDTAKLWVAWDNAPDCTVYAYFSVDSTIGYRDFYAYQKTTNAYYTNFDQSAISGNAISGTNGNGSDCVSNAATIVNAGQPPCQGYGNTTGLPSGILSFFNTQPAPTCKTSCVGIQRNLPLPYCGQNSTNPLDAKFCFFNAGHGDIRPEDTLYATTRALAAYTTNGLTGLGYDQLGSTGCDAQTTKIGCPIYESFGKGGVFYVTDFALSGSDPIGLGTIPSTITMSIGAVPVLVFVNDADTSSGGFGNGAPDAYTITNINRRMITGYWDGTYGCVGDISPSLTAGQGNAVQVVQREMLSGTYNTFEFTGVRTLSGSASTGVVAGKTTTQAWISADEDGQEQGNNPKTNFGGSGCASSGSTPPSSACGDPLYFPTQACANGTGIKLRAIGTGEMVTATLCGESTQAGFNNACPIGTATGGAQNTPDGLGYAFWGYGNFSSSASGCANTTGADACSTYFGHYLTVDGIDPLFITPGGANDPTPNPNGAYHIPQCYLKNSGGPACVQIPFTHVKDGSYPLWTILRAVTFANTTGTTSQTTPTAVVKMIGEAEKSAADVTKNLSDFVPYFTNINAGDTTGNLNLGVLRSHYLQSSIAPSDGIRYCTTYTNLALPPTPGTCGYDTGGDVGGSVITVQSEADFFADYGPGGGVDGSGGKQPAGNFGTRQ